MRTGEVASTVFEEKSRVGYGRLGMSGQVRDTFEGRMVGWESRGCSHACEEWANGSKNVEDYSVITV